MNRQQLGTKLTLDALGIPLNLRTFDGRLMVQKAIYLAKAAGIDFGHFFRWYLRGPYSPDLTRDAFSIHAELSAGLDESSGWELDKDSLARLERVKRIIPANPRENAADAARTLELLASVHFLVNTRQVPRAEVNAIKQLLARYDKNFSEIEISQALDDLRNNELLPR